MEMGKTPNEKCKTSQLYKTGKLPRYASCGPGPGAAPSTFQGVVFRCLYGKDNISALCLELRRTSRQCRTAEKTLQGYGMVKVAM